MTLVSLPSPILWPGNVGSTSNTPGVGGTLVTPGGAGQYGAWVFSAPQDMVVSHVAFRTGAATGSPTGTITIETVDASGFPSGAAGFGSSAGTTATLSANTITLTALGASATITKGQIFAVKIAYASGTSFAIAQANNINYNYTSSFPYQVTNTGSPTRGAVNNNMPLLALGSNSTTFYQLYGANPYQSTGGGTFNNTNSARRGMRFTIPFNCRAIGVRWYNSNASGDVNVAIFDDAGSELSNSSTAIDGDYLSISANSCCSVFFDNTVSLTAGTTYRVAVEPSSATNANVSTYTLSSTNYRSATPSGTTAHYTTFASGSWTDSATDNVPLMDIIIDQVDNGSGTGGVIGVIGG